MKNVEEIVIQLFFEKNTTIGARRKLKYFLRTLLREEGKKLRGELGIIFCSADYLLRVNQEYLKHDYHTDIITFEYSKKGGAEIIAELYISVDRVKETAKELSVCYKNELHRVIFHGVLHLCGYKDKTAAERKVMREKEEVALADYFN